jgi:GNAT superfamily N-acetyltransferase
MPDVVIQQEPQVTAEEFLAVLERSGLAERRPVGAPERIAEMLAHANLIVTARDGGTIVGVSRSVTDFAYCCYCSDLAVDRDYQGRGIGRRLLQATKAALHPNATLYLIAAPKAISYYEHIGMLRNERCFAIVASEKL